MPWKSVWKLIFTLGGGVDVTEEDGVVLEAAADAAVELEVVSLPGPGVAEDGAAAGPPAPAGSVLVYPGAASWDDR